MANLNGVFGMFEYAMSQKLKWPKIVIQARDGLIIVLKRAGQRSRYTGQIMVTDDRPFGSNTYYGRIEQGGTMVGTKALTASVSEALRRFSENPAEVAAEYGKLTGNCCFCQTKLTDDRSTTMGYGPVCAKKWGLRWGKEKESMPELAVRVQEQIYAGEGLS